MVSRQEELSQLKNYINEIDKEVTIILQSLQWDRKLLLQYKPKGACQYNSDHKIPPDKLQDHENRCVLKSQGYVKEDVFLPDAFDTNSPTLIKLTSENIREVINYASKTDPMFQRVFSVSSGIELQYPNIGDANVVSEPLTLERLQATYSVDERRAIYDVVVKAVPSSHELPDLAVPGDTSTPSKSKSKLEQLVELRDLRRRRTRYRVPAGCTNYSHALRALIDAQMDLYVETQGHSKSKYGHESDYKYCLDQSNKSSSDITEKNVTEREGFTREKRNDGNENRRKHDYDEDSNPNLNEKRGKHFDLSYNSRSLNGEKQRSYIKETDNKKYDKYGDRSKNSEKFRNYTRREGRSRYSSSSRDKQRSRDGNRPDRYERDRSSERYRNNNKNERKHRYSDDNRHKKETDYSRRQKRQDI